MQQREAETVENYINRFSATSLKFTALNDVTTLMEMRKFVNGLHPKLEKVVYMSEPTTLEMAQDKAIQAEAIHMPWMLNKNKSESKEPTSV